MSLNSLSKKERLKKNSLIKAVFDKGLCYKHKSVTLYILKRTSDTGINRCAFICRKALYDKKAVLRNRFRRVLREAYRKTKNLLPKGYDIVILATHIKKNTKSTLIESEISDVFKKCFKK